MKRNISKIALIAMFAILGACSNGPDKGKEGGKEGAVKFPTITKNSQENMDGLIKFISGSYTPSPTFGWQELAPIKIATDNDFTNIETLSIANVPVVDNTKMYMAWSMYNAETQPTKKIDVGFDVGTLKVVALAKSKKVTISNSSVTTASAAYEIPAEVTNEFQLLSYTVDTFLEANQGFSTPVARADELTKTVEYYYAYIKNGQPIAWFELPSTFKPTENVELVAKGGSNTDQFKKATAGTVELLKGLANRTFEVKK